MAVSDQLLCSFELLKPLDSSALKSHIKKGRNKRQNMLNSPVSAPHTGKLRNAVSDYSCSLLPYPHRASSIHSSRFYGMISYLPALFATKGVTHCRGSGLGQ